MRLARSHLPRPPGPGKMPPHMSTAAPAAPAPAPTPTYVRAVARASLRWAFTLAALLVVGPIAGLLTGALRNTDGSVHATCLVTESPMQGILAGVGVIVLAAALALPAGRIFGPRFGLRTAGFVICWAAWRTGTVDELLRTAQGSAPLPRLALEGLILAVPAVAAAYLILRLSRSSVPAEIEEFAVGADPAPKLLSLTSLAACAGGLIGAAFLGWLVAIEPLKGQAVFAAFFGGIAAGALGRLAGSGVNKIVPPLPLVLSIVLVSILGPLSPLAVHGSGQAVLDASYAGTLFMLGNITPLDWLGGGLVGLPVGMAWVGSMMEKQDRS